MTSAEKKALDSYCARNGLEWASGETDDGVLWVAADDAEGDTWLHLFEDDAEWRGVIRGSLEEGVYRSLSDALAWADFVTCPRMAA